MRAFIALSWVTAALAAPSFSYETIHHGAAPILSSTSAEEIPNSYIIKFKDHVTAASASEHHSWVQKIHGERENERMELRKRGQIPLIDDVVDVFTGLKHTLKIGTGFLGYAGHFDDAVIEEVRKHPDVEYIEKDQIVYALETPETEKSAPWGLARISHRETLNFGTYNKYLYAADGGEGVDVYVIDTGTNIDHVDFEGRAKWGKTIPKGDEDEDGNGHGTHCSGTVAGKKYGVAKKAHVYAVKVLRSNGSGSMSDVMSGVEWAAEAHMEQVEAAKNGKRKGFKGSTANMSLGGGKSPSLDQAVNAAVSAGLHFAVAAGNDNADACNYSPAAAEKAITVGASALDDSRAYFSNYGKCVDIFGPGLSIQSTWIGSNHAINTISGTSMASPHLCGLTAYFLSLQPASDSDYGMAAITPEKMKSNMLSIATKGALSEIPEDTPNLLAWNGGGYSNYSQIVKEGGYAAKKTPESTLTLEDLEQAIEDDFKVVSGKIVDGISTFSDKAEKFSEKIHDLVDEELKDFLKELRA
ncbi:peptidase S8/S53 domain-containing protein [Xylaria bambusicola]|uniref:peptidase S8/S53 domain-containing protein n=1 Tax=Xylaria bambusicola TaxID=326684 RepID=UPI00200807CE|nr:peptidase S8/S53 domain-containing protein [Xylaria bambusicola]KAI0509184.1 peptidase S8/S53 domain-containing protein [Xylaria bambusicola]